MWFKIDEKALVLVFSLLVHFCCLCITGLHYIEYCVAYTVHGALIIVIHRALIGCRFHRVCPHFSSFFLRSAASWTLRKVLLHKKQNQMKEATTWRQCADFQMLGTKSGLLLQTPETTEYRLPGEGSITWACIGIASQTWTWRKQWMHSTISGKIWMSASTSTIVWTISCC